MDWLPGVTRDPRGGFAWQVDCPTKLVLHSTESGSWPNYPPRYNPHLTVLPIPGKGVAVRQHTPFTQASYALVHAQGTVATNGAHAIQIELVGTCDKSGPRGAYYWPDADDQVLTDLWRQVIKPISDAYGIRLKAPTWKAYPASYGLSREPLATAEAPSPFASPVDPSERTEDDPGAPEGDDAADEAPWADRLGAPLDGPLGSGNGVRFTESAWLAWDGVAGHEHVPGGNVHGDPGAFPWQRLVALTGVTPPPPPKPPAPGKLVVDGDLGPATIRAWQKYLNAHGAKPKLALDGQTGPATWTAVDVWLGVKPVNSVPGRDTVRALQRKVGSPADGVLGPDSIRHLQRYLNAAL